MPEAPSAQDTRQPLSSWWFSLLTDSLRKAGHQIANHPFVSAAIFLSLSPVILPVFHVGEQAQQSVSALCVSWIDESGHVQGLLESGPYGGPLKLYQQDRALYFNILRIWASDIYQSDPQGYDNFEAYFQNAYLPEQQRFNPDSALAQWINRIPYAVQAQDTIANWLQQQFKIQTSDAESMAFTAIALMLAMMRVLGHAAAPRHHEHEDSDLQSPDNPGALLKMLAEGIPQAMDNTAACIMWLSIAAAMMPSLGIGVSWYAELLDQPDWAATAAQLSGMAGHTMSVDSAAGFLSLLSTLFSTHTMTCIAPPLVSTAVDTALKQVAVQQEQTLNRAVS